MKEILRLLHNLISEIRKEDCLTSNTAWRETLTICLHPFLVPLTASKMKYKIANNYLPCRQHVLRSNMLPSKVHRKEVEKNNSKRQSWQNKKAESLYFKFTVSFIAFCGSRDIQELNNTDITVMSPNSQ